MEIFVQLPETIGRRIRETLESFLAVVNRLIRIQQVFAHLVDSPGQIIEFVRPIGIKRSAGQFERHAESAGV